MYIFIIIGFGVQYKWKRKEIDIKCKRLKFNKIKFLD